MSCQRCGADNICECARLERAEQEVAERRIQNQTDQDDNAALRARLAEADLWTGAKVRVRQDWYEFGKVGTALGPPVFVKQHWLPVKWDDEDDPTFFKLAGISIDAKGAQ